MKNRVKLTIVGCGFVLYSINIYPQPHSQGINYSIIPQTSIEFEELKQGFQTVPDESKLRCWWTWIRGVATKQSITQDLEEMKAKGYGGATIWSKSLPFDGGPAGPVYMSNEWMENFAHAVKEGDRIGMELTISIDVGAGSPGNPNIQPDNGLKKIVFSELNVTGPKSIQETLPDPPSQIYYKDIAVQAIRIDESGQGIDTGIKNWEMKTLDKSIGWKHDKDKHSVLDMLYESSPERSDDPSIDPDHIIDLSTRFREGILTWEVPPGEWTIIRYGMSSTGRKNLGAGPGYPHGLCYDQINSRGVNAHWNDIARPLLEVAKESGNSLKFVLADSWEMGMTNWTHGFAEEFEKLRGYDMMPYLPVLTNKIVGDRELSNRFLEDFRLTVGELLADQNYAILRDLAHTQGVLLNGETGGPHAAPIDALQTLGRNDIPMGEFWARSNSHRTTEGQRMHVKQGSSAAHIYGKRFLAAEGPTVLGPAWERSPRDLKNVIDRAFCDGVNRIFWHTYSSSPDEYGLPGIVNTAGAHLNRKVTWWEQSGSFINYINRCQFMLSQGLYCADILNYYGSGVPNYVFLNSDLKGVPQGYAWDMCNSEVLLSRAEVKNGRIYLPDGMSYSLLALSDRSDMPLAVLKKIEQMVKEGIILVGKPPERVSGLTGYPGSDQELNRIVKRLWGEIDQRGTFLNKYGKGKVYGGKSIGEVLILEGIRPDFSCSGASDIGMEYIHRTTDNMEIYYVTNKWARHGIDDYDYRYLADEPDRYMNVLCSFRVDGEREIERWDPVTGEMTPVRVYKHEGDRYEIPVSLSPEGSAFFVFKKSPGEEKANIIMIEKEGVELTEGNAPLVTGASRIFVQDRQVEIFREGDYRLTRADGKIITIQGTKIPEEQIINGPWKVHFMEKPSLGEPVTKEFDSLRSWTEFPERSIKYFSGTARYTKSVTLRGNIIKQGRIYLDLGNVQELATVRVNGSEVTTCWIAPYHVDITDYVRKGQNILEIDVTNLWVNRMVGDGKLPQEERRTQTNYLKSDLGIPQVHKTKHPFKFYSPDADKFVRVSGLLGPVKLQFSQIHQLE